MIINPIVPIVNAGGGVQTYSGTITPASQGASLNIVVPKSNVTKPQVVVIAADLGNLQGLAGNTTVKVACVRAATTSYSRSDISSTITDTMNAANGFHCRMSAAGYTYGNATATFSDGVDSTLIGVSQGGYFRSDVTYNFEVYGWEDSQ